MNAPASITITPVRVADLLAEGERMPVYVHVIDHPDARVLVDTGMTELHPAVADLDPRLRPLSEQDFDLAGIDIVVNTHLHFDHCGGNHLFAGRPIYVQRRELDDARSEDDYTIREWVEAPGVRYVPVDGELELLPGLRLVPAPGHTRGMQVVVVETGGRPVVVGGDVAVWFGELDEPHTEGQLRVRALDPELVWLAHEHEPWRPAVSKRHHAGALWASRVPHAGERILGTLGSAEGKGIVRMEARFDADIDEVWSALTDPSRLARWYGAVEGDLRLGGEYRARLFASGWEGTGRVEACEPPQRLLVRIKDADEPENEIEVMLTADGDQTIVDWEERELPWVCFPRTGPGCSSMLRISLTTSPGVSAARTSRRDGSCSTLPIKTWRPTSADDT